MSIINIVGFIVGLPLLYLGYLTGPLQWRIARKAIRAVEALKNIDPIELDNIRQVSSSIPFFPPMSILFFALGMIACFPLVNAVFKNQAEQKLHSNFSNAEKSDLSNAEKSLLSAADPKDLESSYRKGIKALEAKEYVEAENLIRKAALGGISAAQFSLAAMYENGFGLPKDGIQACYWYRVAADNKNTDAEKALERPTKAKKGEEKITWQLENC